MEQHQSSLTELHQSNLMELHQSNLMEPNLEKMDRWSNPMRMLHLHLEKMKAPSLLKKL